MNNPIKIYNEIRDAYLKYINSGLPFFRNEYNLERNELLRSAGTISQPPIIELVPKYHEKASLKEFCINEGINTEINDFISAGLFVSNATVERKLYDHQYDALKEAFLNRKNIVVTTGTGSGKTECFLLPIISGLVKESAFWDSERPRAIRTMILYPLNALAEDQMIRLRKALNSRREGRKGALDWLDSNRFGHRFYFGRYTGRTPVSGEKDKVRTILREEKLVLERGWKAAKEAAVKNNNPDLLYHVPCMEADSAEMWDRFSMQENAPDILITNYSMLNIMLMRENEEEMFESTKRWLAEDPSHVFHLVIDELHTYRGTSGTEVAYLIRILLDRLGLTPESPQVQFLSSSASLEESQQSMDYLREFFGLSSESFQKKFIILSNPKVPTPEKPSVSLPEEILLNYSNDGDDARLMAETGCSTYLEIAEKFRLLEWLRYALSSGDRIIAKDVLKIASALGYDEERGLPIVSSIVKIICQTKQGNNYLAPIRAHYFFRNVSGLWACTDPNCKDKRHEYDFENRAVGRFYKRPRVLCTCGNNVLDILVCENCGELYFGGYKIIRDNKTFLSAERPMTETFVRYCALWKGEVPLDNNTDGWTRVSYNPVNGEYHLDRGGEYSIYEQPSENDSFFPHKCSQCEIKYKVDDKDSFTPIRWHGTGLQKVNQILADALIRSMKNENEDNTKVVLFSDSRQSAAKLSAGIELDHYRDVLRWAILSALKGNESATDFLKTMFEKDPSNATDEEKMHLRQLQNDNAYKTYADLVMYRLLGIPPTEEDTEKINAFCASTSAQRLDSIEDDVFSELLSLGINPAGPKPSAFENINGGFWYNLFDFNTLKVRTDLSDSAVTFSDRIFRLNRIEQLTSIFSNKKRSFEELRLGYLAPTTEIPDRSFYEYVCTVIRIMGEKKRIKDLPRRYQVSDSFPKNVRKITKAIYQCSSLKEENEHLEHLKVFLRQNGIIDQDKALLTGNGLSFVKAEEGSQYWECPKCKTIHMHHSNGFCVNCVASLGAPSILTKEEIENPEDYYLTILNSTDKVYRLHCEEMTGQTAREDSQKRQRYFQDIFLQNENPRVNGIDLLSVTTTMEAGVDIGSLSAVMMGNIPPQRFNYQQRVGRAGRRGNPLSIALTVAKGTSHDLTNFFEYERMVSDTPKDPYLEVRTKEIAERIIYKEVLFFALKTTSPSKGENVHGNFGKVDDWERKKDDVQDWINSNDATISHIITTVTRGTDISTENKNEIKDYINNHLLDRISEVAHSDDYNQEYLSERLANAGLLPMFGFPTLTRELYLKEPDKLPSENAVSRDIDMALSSFAPGHEIVKDKKVYLAVGVVDYTYQRGQIVPRKNALNPYLKPLHRCTKCGYSTISSAEGENRCPVCDEPMQEISICSPLGFCVDYRRPVEDFNGSYDWYSPNSDIKLDCEDSLSPCDSVQNMSIRNNIIPSMGLVHLVNDNNGDFYVLGKRPENEYKGIYISKDAYPEEERNFKLFDEKKYAFVASKSTGVLTLSVTKVPSVLNLSPLRSQNEYSHFIRSAFISWGYLVRKAVASYLDIDSSELSVGYYITPGTKKAEVFFVEKLENGAGYCNFLSGRRYPDVPQKAIIDPLLPGGNIYEHLVSDEHANECSTSCYDCIRDYSNQYVHGLLDWRLGLDIARLANDASAKVDFTVDYWKEHLHTTIASLLKSRGYSVDEKENTLLAVNIDGHSILVIHPFWSTLYIDELKTRIGGNPTAVPVNSLVSTVIGDNANH
jgi:Lhr-like helicase